MKNTLKVIRRDVATIKQSRQVFKNSNQINMEIKKKREAFVKEIEYVDSVECDKCLKEIDPQNFNTFKCRLKLEEGDIYPEGGYTDIKTVDLCEDCSSKLFEYLDSENYRINISDKEY